MINPFNKLRRLIDVLRDRGVLSYPTHTPAFDSFHEAIETVRLIADAGGKEAAGSVWLRLLPSLHWWGEMELARHGAAVALEKEAGIRPLSIDCMLALRILQEEPFSQVPVFARLCSELKMDMPDLASLTAQLLKKSADKGFPILDKASLVQGLHELGRTAEAEALLADLEFGELSRSKDGLVLLKMASVFFRIGKIEAGEKLFGAFLKSRQRPHFFSTSLHGAATVLERAIAFLEALRDRVMCTFEVTAPRFPTSIAADDGRFQIIDEVVSAYQPQTVADVGCGKGRFIRLLQQRHPAIQAWAVDISTRMLKELPEGITAKAGTLLHSGLADESMDLVFCVEALEHAVNVRAGVRELARITRSGGRLIIIDKNANKLGKLQICDWEHWFDVQQLTRWLEEEGFTVQVRGQISHGGISGQDGLFSAWIGVKR